MLPPAQVAEPSYTSPEQHRFRVLSMQLSGLGIATYSRQMRAYFADSQTCAVDSVWWDEDRHWQDRLFRRLLVLDDAVLRGRAGRSWIRRQNLDLHRLRGDYGPAFSARRLLLQKLRETNYDVLHIHPQSLSHASLDLMRRIPTVLQTDMTAAQLAQEKTLPFWRWTFAPNIALDRRAFESACRVVAWSEWTAQSLREDYGIGPSQIRVIYPGVDVENFAFEPRLPRSGRVRLLFTGYDFRRKGGYDVLDVFLSSLTESAELHLMTTAPIECRHPHVHVHRNITAFSPQWHALYAQADIFVMPTYFEGLPMACVEAAAAALPIVSSRVCAIPELVGHGENGLLVTPGRRDELTDALQTLIHSPALRLEMGRRGREVAENRFNARTNFKQLEAVFCEASRYNSVVQ